MPILTLLSDSGGGGGSTTTNYALLLALTSDVPAVTPPTGTTNYALLLALTSEAGAVPPPAPKVGSLGRKRRAITSREFEAEQPKPFGRKWFAEFQAAQRAAREAALEAPKKAARKALDRAADAAAQVADELDASDAQVDLRPLTAALEALSGAKKLSETIAASKGAVEWANRIVAELKRAADEDEDEAMTLLMLG